MDDMKKTKDIKITYRYVEPKTKEEAEESERRLQKAFDILFEATLASEEWKQYQAKKLR